jgi:hypothetical protein
MRRSCGGRASSRRSCQPRIRGGMRGCIRHGRPPERRTVSHRDRRRH